MKTIFAAGALSLAFLAPLQAQAAGCLSGAAVGGVAGHVAGHHTVLGAVAGCAVGHHMAHRRNVERRRELEMQRSGYDPANPTRSRQ